ncbi:MFS family permease [Streptomyces sp. B3I7]|uniref:MFS transporter n=1 Tax=Streptomyces sp. B3I7 TaxID=3042269 RepID=UPI002788B3A7|nr:MFS transporter [Streptomyces sp. B3I7]MDQ0815167.1 MFS family permease [Streptomyces sp. B3I7]
MHPSAPEETVAPAPRPADRSHALSWTPDLLRDTAFRRYWTAQTVSYLGDQVSALTLPLIAVTVVHAGAVQMGCLSAAAWLPHLLFGPYAGLWADRRSHRRRVMIAADLGRFTLLLGLALFYAFGTLTFTVLFAMAFGVGLLSVLFEVCNPPLFKALVPPEHYVSGNSLSSGSRAMAKIVGPSAGGFLVQLLSAPAALLVDAVSYLVSAVQLARIAPQEAPPSTERARLRTACRFIVRSRTLRAALAATATVNFFCFVTTTLFVLYATTSLGLGAGLLGTVLGAGAVGAVVGAVSATPLTRGLGVGRTFLLGCLASTAPLLLIPAAHGAKRTMLLMLVGAQFGSAMGVIWIDITAATLLTSHVPDAMRSSVFGAYQGVNLGMRPLAALLAGAAAGPLGLRTTLWIATAGALTACLWILPSPLSRRTPPEAVHES